MKQIFILIFTLLTLFHSTKSNLTDTNLTRASDSINILKETLHNLNHLDFEKLLSTIYHSKINEKIDEKSLSKRCLKDTYSIFLNIKSDWAKRMLDAQAKPPSGIMDGHLNWIGDVGECVNTRSFPTKMWNIEFEAFSGKYCSARFNLLNKTMEGLPNLLKASYGLCVPNTCYFNDIDYDKFNQDLLIYTELIPKLHKLFENIQLSNVECLGDTSTALSAGAIVVIVIYSLLAMLVVVGTGLDYYQQCHSQDNLGDGSINTSDTETLIYTPAEPGVLTKLLICFSLKQHIPKVLSLESRKQDLACLHGIRVLSISWVVFGHTFFGFLSVANNLTDLVRSLDNLPSELLLQAPLSVDSFFVLSGLLMTYLFLTQAKKININWPLFYVHRYLRLTPTYMLILAFWTTLYPYLGSGPLWSLRLADNCPSSWWQNLIYINNFYDISCMGWSWYLANDMQFFIISPLFLIPLLKNKTKSAFAIMTALLISSWIATAIIVDYNGILPMFSHLDANNLTAMGDVMIQQQKSMTYIYTKPYCRIGPYLIGAATGYFIYKTRNRKDFSLSKIQAASGWLLGAACLLVPIFSTYHSPDTKFVSISFMMWHRSCWALGLCWLIFACLNGYGGVINKFLSLPHWQPLSRLTYCLYLIHLIVVFTVFSSLPNTLPYHPVLMLVMFGGFLAGSYLLSLVASLVLESPVMALEKWALGRSG